MDNPMHEAEHSLIEQLIKARRDKGFTQRQLAEASGIGQSVIARIESARSIPTVHTLMRLLTPLDYHISISPNSDS